MPPCHLAACWPPSLLPADCATGSRQFEQAYPDLHSIAYSPARPDLDDMLAAADLVIVHEWNEHELVARIGEHRPSRGRYRLLFHDTHHRSVTDRKSMAAYNLSGYDGAPLLCSPREDAERLFAPGQDFLVTRTGKQMRECMQAMLVDDAVARSLARHGRRTILARHTCAHRVRQLLEICHGLGLRTRVQRTARPRLVEV